MRRALGGLLAITTREIGERAALLGLAAAVAVVPFVAPHAGFGDRPLLARFLGSIVLGTAAVMTGSSVIARDLAEGRLGFFFARPVPSWSIWGGKLLAALLLTFAAGGVAVLPASWWDRANLPTTWWFGAILIPALLALIGASHALTLGYRSRSPWFALDLGLAAALGWLAADTFRTLEAWGANPRSADFASAVLWFIALALTVAGAVGFARGRTDIRRAHRGLSATFWSLAAPAVVGGAAWGAWVARASPSDVAQVRLAVPAPSGPWIATVGLARGGTIPTLLVDTESGRFLRLGPFGSVYGPLFSEDGARALWIAHERSGRRLRTADLRVSAPDISDHPLPLPGEPILGLALSADGSTIAVVQSRQVSVVPIGAERPVVAAHGGPGSVRQAVFTADGRVRALRRVPEAVGASGLEVIEIDPRTRRVSVGGEIATRGNPTEIWARGGELVVVLHRPDFRPSLTLHDGRDGRLLATPVAEGGAGRASMAFLADGRLAVVSATRSTDLHLFDGQGRLTATVQVAPWFALARVVPVGDDLLAVEVPYQADKTDTVLVEASTGRVLRREQGLQPGSRPWPWLGLPSAPTGDLFIDHRGALVRLDLATGDRNVILGGGDREF